MPFIFVRSKLFSVAVISHTTVDVMCWEHVEAQVMTKPNWDQMAWVYYDLNWAKASERRWNQIRLTVKSGVLIENINTN